MPNSTSFKNSHHHISHADYGIQLPTLIIAAVAIVICLAGVFMAVDQGAGFGQVVLGFFVIIGIMLTLVGLGYLFEGALYRVLDHRQSLPRVEPMVSTEPRPLPALRVKGHLRLVHASDDVKA